MSSRCASTVRLTVIATEGSCHRPGTTPRPLSRTNSLTDRFRMQLRRSLVIESLEDLLELAGVEQTGDHLGHVVDAGLSNNQPVGAP